ncbi:MAG TPA: patatin-like phospholipase family protein [Candidatus Izemoplasmatales bacterium]|nr:patatin-like phospholipase family protein [Candidatus Izemoplasmatales bacterium]
MNRLGLCLSGGGARGSYQIGACQALKELGYYEKIYAFSGTSIGAVNASLLASRTIDEVKKIWFDFPRNELNYIESLMKKIRARDFSFVKNGVIDIENLEELLSKNIDYKTLKEHMVYITLSPAGLSNEGSLGIIKASFNHYIRGRKKVIYSPLQEQKKEDINKQIIASCSIPFVFRPVTINGRQTFDGGLYDNIPIKPLVDAGCDTVIVLNLQKLIRYNPKKFPGIDIKEIKHKKSLGAVLNFEKNQSMARYDLGYEDTMAYFKENPLDI